MYYFKEIISALLSWKIWLTIAVEDVIGKYRRTFLGPIWVIISQSAFIFGIYAVRHNFNSDSTIDYLLFLAISVPTWGLIASFLVDSSNALLRAKGYIESYPLPMPVYLIRSVVAALINFSHVLLVFILIAVFRQLPLHFEMLLFVPAMAILTIFGFGVCLGISIIGARFRDLGPALSSFVGFMFVFAPIFWTPTKEQIASPLIKYNPFFYLLEIVRNPLLGKPVPMEYWVASICITIAALVFGAISYRSMRSSIVYWL